MDRVAEVRAFAAHLREGRTAREKEWRELAEWIAPYRGVFTGEDLAPSGERRNGQAFTQAATQALLRGASGMTSGMTPRNISWFEPDFEEASLAEASGARAWLDEVDRRMKTTLAEGGFYQAIHNFNTDLLWSGCALLYSEVSASCALRFECVQVGSFCVALDGEGRLDAVCRAMIRTPAWLAATFGRDALSPATRRRLDRQPYSPVRVMHLVRRRDFAGSGSGHDSGHDAVASAQKQGGHTGNRKGHLPWESLFWEDSGSSAFLHEGGYHEIPYFFTVWHESTTPYGIGPGDDALPDSRQFDLMERHKLEGLAKLVNPPVQMPGVLKSRPDLAPGGITSVTERVKIEPILDLNAYAQSFQYLQDELRTVSQRLEQSLMASIFASMPLDQRPHDMSATEFLARRREAMQQLGPVMSAYEPNVLSPLLHRTAATLDRAGLLPPPPPDLAGLPLLLKMVFVSPLANALRQTGAETTRALLQDAAMLAQMQPEVLDKLDLDQAIDELASGLGVPGKIVRADADVAALRQARAHALAVTQQEMMDQARVQHMVGTARELAGTAKTLDDINSAQQQTRQDNG